ncbi:MAG: SprT family zinc-dependent metalloprotease [Cyanobacteria bacterium P01_A01_bin.45]
MPILQIGETNISYTIRYSTRSKRSRIVVTPQSVEVVAPVNTPEEKINIFVNSKKHWLLKAFTQTHLKYPPKAPQSYVNGAQIMYQGDYFKLQIESTDVKTTIISHPNCFHIQVPQNLNEVEQELIIRQALIDWKRLQVYPEIQKFVQIYAPKLKVKPNSIKLSQQKRAWGTCSSKGNIRINWRLADAPLPVLEYVVAHEVTHLVHPNHSKDFWQTLSIIMPDWKQRKANLKSWETQLSPL